MPRWHRWLAVLAGMLWTGTGMIQAQEVAGVDESIPLIVSDGEDAEANLVPPETVSLTPATPSPATGVVGELTGDQEVVRKAIVSEAVLLDPTSSPAGQVSGGDPPASMLLPLNPSGTGPKPALTQPETPAVVKPVAPIMGSAPFPKEAKSDGGPVVMGTDLQPDAEVTPLTPDQADPDFLDGPVVEATDPWVFGVEVGSVYDDNITLSRENRQEDFIFVLSASVAWQWGDVRLKRGSWARVFYKATGILFLEQSDEDSLDHDFQAGIQRRGGRLTTTLEGRYRRLSGATPDLGDRVRRDEYQGKLSASYDLSARTFLEANAAYHAVRYREAGLSDYHEFLGELFAGYEVSGRTRVSVGGGAGQMKTDGADRQNFQRALVKVNRASTGALGLTGKAGAEFRQTPTGNGVTPVFGVAAEWEPVEDGTKVTAEVFRETVASGAMAGENYLRTGGALRLTQRLGSRFVAGLETGYERLDYNESEDIVASGRQDDYFYAKPSVKYEFNNRRRAEVFYSFREDHSSLEDFSFTANQWGLSFGLDF